MKTVRIHAPTHGARVGDVIDVCDAEADWLCAYGYAVLVEHKPDPEPERVDTPDPAPDRGEAKRSEPSPDPSPPAPADEPKTAKRSRGPKEKAGVAVAEPGSVARRVTGGG